MYWNLDFFFDVNLLLQMELSISVKSQMLIEEFYLL